MIIICTTLIREKHAGVFVENAIAYWFSLLSHIQLTLMTHTDNDDDDADWKMQ